MVNLTVLDVDGNQILDITPLKDMTNLIELDLHDNKILDITYLKDMINLVELDLDDNAISDVSALSGLVNLRVLDLSGNHISDFSPLAGLIGNLVEYDASNQTFPAYKMADVNRDGVVDIADLILIATNDDEPDLEALAGMNIYPDVNSDSVVDVKDLLAAAAEIGSAAAPMLSKSSVDLSTLSADRLARWIRLAKELDTPDPRLRKGLAVLEQFLAVLSEVFPKETALLANYPNPFNPETWIPYQLSEPVAVIISIHSSDGKLVRTLELGNLSAGVYRSKSRAAYWDGRNEVGESVASGIYFYTLTAGDFRATGKMLIRK